MQEKRVFEILECLHWGHGSKKYSENVRLFCITHFFYSPKAYEYLRTTFNSNLPAARTIRSWFSSIDSSPGFTDAAFDALRQRAEEANSKQKDLLVGLIMDEVSIRQHSQYDLNKKKFIGHNDAGNLNSKTDDGKDLCTPIAKDALVLMVSGINNEFKIPIAYFLTTGLTATEKAFIMDQALYKLKAIGVKVVSFTFDGAKSNIAAAQFLGADFKMEKPYFENPHDKGNNVYFVLDPPHMLKLARNCLGNKKILFDRDGNRIRWQLLHELIMLQLKENINLGNKLTKTHLEFENRKMNVRIAAETLSNSAATSIEYLDHHQKHRRFKDSEGTTKYIRTINNLFDIMNTKMNHCKDGYKRPISEETIGDFESYFDYAKDYIKGLHIIQENKKISVLKARINTPFTGFLNNMVSFVGIYKEYIKKDGDEEFYTFTVSQDHLESFFGCIRRMGSTNDNPTAQQFSGAYRKLLFYNEVTSSDGSNCENDLTKILTVSSNKKRNPDCANEAELQMLRSHDFEDIAVIQRQSSNSLYDSSIALLAGKIEKKIIEAISRKGKKRCLKCIDVFTENEIITDELMELKSNYCNVFEPCKSTLEIIHIVDMFLNRYDEENIKVSYHTAVAHVFENIDLTHLYESSCDDEFDDSHDHRAEIVKLIIREYMDQESMQFGKDITRLSQKKLIRHNRLKLIHVAGQ